MTPRRPRYALLAALWLAATLPGCGSLSPRRVGERRIAGLLQRMVGPAESYQVRISRDGDTDLLAGRISRLQVSGASVRARGGLLIDRVEGELVGVRFNRKRESLEAVVSSDLLATVSSESAVAYLNARDTSLRDLRVDFEEGRVRLSARRDLPAGLSLPVVLEGAFQLDGPRWVSFVPDSLSVARLSLPRVVVSYVERRINPVFDLDVLGLPLDLDRVEVQPGRVLLRGHLAIPPGGLLAEPTASLPRAR